LKLENGDVTVCPECFLKIKKEYEARKTCDDCAFFKKGYCRKIRTDLTPAWIGADVYEFRSFHVQREKCVHYIAKREYEANAIRGKTESRLVSCKYCRSQYDLNKNAKCPWCGAPTTQ
jgi:hypothetical protein